jgi:hypothetical protein
MTYKFYKKRKNDAIWWVDNLGRYKGEHLFSFDKKKVYNLFRDYPRSMTKKEVEIFDMENPFWADFFSNRQ